jgi:hypothetical protein
LSLIDEAKISVEIIEKLINKLKDKDYTIRGSHVILVFDGSCQLKKAVLSKFTTSSQTICDDINRILEDFSTILAKRDAKIRDHINAQIEKHSPSLSKWGADILKKPPTKAILFGNKINEEMVDIMEPTQALLLKTNLSLTRIKVEQLKDDLSPKELMQTFTSGYQMLIRLLRVDYERILIKMAEPELEDGLLDLTVSTQKSDIKFSDLEIQRLDDLSEVKASPTLSATILTQIPIQQEKILS